MEFPSHIKVTFLLVNHIFDFDTSEKGEQILTGVEAKLLNTLANTLRFQYEHLIPPDNKLGIQDESGNWSGVMGILSRQEADFGMGGIAVLSKRLEAVDFSQVYGIQRLIFLVEKPGTLPAVWAFVRIFDSVIWGLILLMIIIVPIASAFLLNLKSDLIKTYLQFFGSILHQSLGINQKSTGSRIFITSWLIFGLVISYSYSACLLSYLSLPLQGKPITRFAELSQAVRKGTHRCLMLNGAPSINLLSSSGDDHLKFLGGAIRKNGWFYEADEIMEPEVVAEKTAVVNTEFNLQVLSAKLPPNRYVLSEDALTSFKFGIALRKGFCCTKRLNMVLSWITAAGLVQKYQRDELMKVRIKSIKLFSSPISDVQQLSIKDLSGVFSILALGHLVSLLAFLGEVIYSRINNKYFK